MPPDRSGALAPERPHVTSHPLDILPLFRRWPPSPLRDLLYTGLFNALIALAVTAAGRFLNDRPGDLWTDLYPSLVVSNFIGYLTHGALMLSNRLLHGWAKRAMGWRRVLYYLALVGACAILGILLGTSVIKGVAPWHYLTRSSSLFSLIRFSLVVSILIAILILAGERRIEREMLAARQREEIANAARLLAEARLRGLQAQIEPHFLYNTLANVVGLIERRPAQARHMLERFIDYLRASLAASRADMSTLGTELDLAAAYLDVLAVRMGARLSYSIEADDACRALPLAPMLLQPVIENAVAHGLEPNIAGGHIHLRANRSGDMLKIEVADSGIGLTDAPPKPGGGVGLSNLRTRLRSLYGAQAQVSLTETVPCGITVRILVPIMEDASSTIHAH